MRGLNAIGFTLVELLVAIGIFAMIAAGATALLTASLNAQNQGDSRVGLYWEGSMLMERMASALRNCTYLLIPNAHQPTRDFLAFSGIVNEDDDFYFDDPLFPRIDEDPDSDLTDDGLTGIGGVDDDGDGSVDENPKGHYDNDEDGSLNEDPLDGIDNDEDGNVDEDPHQDVNGDNLPGIALVDDNGDGTVDNGGHFSDDDEDGEKSEDGLNALLYSLVSGTSTLQVKDTHSGQITPLSTSVGAFEVTFDAPDRVLITLTLTDDEGKNLTLSEYVHLENTFQRLGKRVR